MKIERRTATITFSEDSGAKEIEAHLAPLAMDVSSDVLGGENRGRKLAHNFVALDLVSRKLKNEEFTVEIPFDYPAAKAVAVWVTSAGSVTPAQAAGGYLR